MMKRFSIVAIGLTLSLGTVAQTSTSSKDTAIKGATIEVIQSYKPEVKQRPKQEYTPTLPPVDHTRPVFNYSVPQQTLNYTYSSLPLRPLALGKDTTPSPYPSYIKLGGGNLSTFYVDAGIGNIKGKNYETSIHLHSITQQGNIQYQKSSLSDFEASGTLHKDGKQWHAFVYALHNEYNNYGYDHFLYQPTVDSIKQSYTSVKAGLDMTKENLSNTNFNFHPYVSASVYSGKFSTTETSITLGVPFYYKLDTSLDLQLAAGGIITQYHSGSLTISNNIFKFDPGINYHTRQFWGHAYLSPAIGTKEVYLLPNLEANFNIPKTLFIVNAGWNATINQNTYEQLTTENPHVFSSFTAISTLYQQKQTRSDEIFGGIKTNLGDHISISGRLSFWKYDYLPLFVNNTGDQKQFNVIYDNGVNATTVQATVTYHIANKFAADAQLQINTYFNGNETKVWYQPGFRLTGTIMYHPISPLTVTAYARILDQVYAELPNSFVYKLDPILDIGGSTEYALIPRLSVFVRITNLLNNKNERWLGYGSFGTNIYGGLRFKF